MRLFWTLCCRQQYFFVVQILNSLQETWPFKSIYFSYRKKTPKTPVKFLFFGFLVEADKNHSCRRLLFEESSLLPTTWHNSPMYSVCVPRVRSAQHTRAYPEFYLGTPGEKPTTITRVPAFFWQSRTSTMVIHSCHFETQLSSARQTPFCYR